MNKRILITGATGFVGRQILRCLLAEGAAVRVIIRAGKEDIFLNMAGDIEIVTTCDMFSETTEWWRDKCSQINSVVHAAWYVNPEDYLKSLKNLDCLTGSINLALGAAQAGIKKFIGIGTCFEYDLSFGFLSVDTPLRPTTLYGDAKAALYFSLSHWLGSQGIDFAWCRLFYLYGEREDPRRLVSYLRSKLEAGEYAELTSGKQIRDFLDVADAGQMISKVILGKQVGPINVCSGIPVTVRGLSEKIADEYGRRNLLQFGARVDNLTDPICVLGKSNII
jgi:nucleoside-diphosphate-sugar epimerase